MFLGDRRHQRDIGLGNFTKNGDLTRQAGAQLDHRDLRLWLQREQRKRYADSVVQIARRRVDSKRSTECRLDEILRARLPVAASDTDDGFSPGPSPVMRERSQCNERVANLEDGHIQRGELGCMRYDNSRGAIANRVSEIIMTVETLALQRNEHMTYLNLARVGGDAADG